MDRLRNEAKHGCGPEGGDRQADGESDQSLLGPYPSPKGTEDERRAESGQTDRSGK